MNYAFYPGCVIPLQAPKFNKLLNTPVIFYSQLLSVALGIDPESLGLEIIHRIRTNTFLERAFAGNG